MTAHIWGAHAARVLVMAARHRELSSVPLNRLPHNGRKIVSARTPKPAREPRALPGLAPPCK